MAAESLQGKTLLITGSSRGIGQAIALRAARDGANIVVIGKTDTPHDRLPGTIHSSARDIEAAGGQALPCAVDIRHEQQVADAVSRAVDRFGGIDIVVNNASAIFLAGTADTPLKRYDLMQAVNVRGTFVTTQCCLPHLLRADNPHVLNIAPPLNFEARWFAPHLAYSMAKYGMSLCVLGMAEEFRERGVAVNALWPRTAIATAAISNILGGEALLRKTRRPEIMADAAHAILVRGSRTCTGQFFIDDQVLAETGVTDLTAYAVDPESELMPDFFV